MLNRKLAAALLIVLGIAATSPCIAATRLDIHAGAMGRAASSTLASRLGVGVGFGW